MKQLMILMLVCLLVLPMINAESFGNFQKDNDVRLIIQCQNSTYLNISSIYTNKNIYINTETITTKSGNNYNYTLLNSTELGTYYVKYHCNLNSIDTPAASYFIITTTGYETNTPQIFVMFFIVGIIFIISLFLFIFGMKVEIVSVKIFCLSLTTLLIIFLVGYILGIANITIGEFSDLINGFTPLYILFISLLSVGAIGLILYLIAFSLDAFKRKRGLKL